MLKKTKRALAILTVGAALLGVSAYGAVHGWVDAEAIGDNEAKQKLEAVEQSIGQLESRVRQYWQSLLELRNSYPSFDGLEPVKAVMVYCSSTVTAAAAAERADVCVALDALLAEAYEAHTLKADYQQKLDAASYWYGLSVVGTLGVAMSIPFLVVSYAMWREIGIFAARKG